MSKLQWTILKLFAQYIKDSIRPSDIACKFGGEEFVVILPDTDMEGAKILAERLRVGLKTKSILDAITVSIGIGCFTPREDAKDKPLHNVDKISEHLIKRADDAVYRAKHLGRNRVCVSETLYQSKQ